MINGALDESVIRAPVVRGAEEAFIEVTAFEPQGSGPLPIVVLRRVGAAR